MYSCREYLVLLVEELLAVLDVDLALQQVLGLATAEVVDGVWSLGLVGVDVADCADNRRTIGQLGDFSSRCVVAVNACFWRSDEDVFAVGEEAGDLIQIYFTRF